jgi:uncharacterized cupredoxin-like copper-binding protein
MNTRPLLAIAVAVALSGCGAGTATNASAASVMNIEMTNFAFTPSHIQVHAGTTIRFRFHNAATIAHEAFIGDQSAQVSHDAEMGRPGGMGGMHDPNEVEVEPGATKDVTYRFSQGDNLILGCHESGHYAAGMRATITVA